MEQHALNRCAKLSLLGLVSTLSAPAAALAQSVPSCPDSSLNLSASGLALDYNFGTRSDRNVRDLAALAEDFEPRSSNFGETPINNEWERYADFNDRNHYLAEDHLELTARVESRIAPAGISSGELASKRHFYPADGQTLVFQLRAQIPHGDGTWPAFWLYSPGGESSTESEIDIFEFWNNATQDTLDWTGYDHGDGVGQNLCSSMTNEWVWHPGIDFADDYHVYSLVWQQGVIEKWVDSTLVKRSQFEWYGPAPQLLINLAIGGNEIEDPTSETFPAVFRLDYLRVFAL